MKIQLSQMLLSVAVVLALLTGCNGTASEPATPSLVPPTAEPSATPQPSATPVPPTNTPEPSATPTTPPTPTPEISADMQTRMDEIQVQISNLRGLSLTTAQEADMIDTREFEQYLAEKLEKEYTEEEEFQELVTLSYLGLISPFFDIREFVLQLYSEQVLGFYEAEKDQMFLLQGAHFDPLGQMTYAHEFVHAMVDGTFDIDGKLAFTDEQCDQQGERCAALRALMEGDASIASALWMMANLSPAEQAEVGKAGQQSSPILESAPAVYQEDMLFPYSVGTAFVSKLYQQGGWAAVDAAYLNPPVSTEQIMHPDRYPSDVPIEVTLPDLLPVLGEGWELLDQGTLGEWHSLLLLTSGVDPQANQTAEAVLPAVTGWGGDRYQVYIQQYDQLIVLVLKTRWDTAADAQEFYTALNQHVLARFDLDESETDLMDMFVAMQLGYAQYQLMDDTTYYILSPAEEISTAVLAEVLK